MSQEEAFLKQLCSHPEDDDTRLIYADWLEDHDDIRGQYLRLEHRLADLPEDHPGEPTLERELIQLRKRLSLEWVRMAGKQYDVWLVRYRPDLKIACIKVIRELNGMGLKEAKDVSESLPAVVLKGVSRDVAEDARRRFQDYSASWMGWSSDLPAGPAITVRLRTTGSPKPGTYAAPLPTTLGPFTLRLVNYEPRQKIAVIRAIREITNCGLAEGKALSEQPLPVALGTFQTNEGAQGAAQHFHDIAQVEVVGDSDAPPGAFMLVLRGYAPDKKIAVIKQVREITGMGLAEAKMLVEQQLPAPIRVGISWSQARELEQRFGTDAAVVIREMPAGG